MPIELTGEMALLVVDMALVVAGAAGYLLMRRIRPLGSLDVKSAFGVLDRSISKYVPGVGQGFTWTEAFERLKESGVEADWEKMGARLAEYEAYRYGGREEPKQGQGDVVSLAAKLRRTIVGRGT